MGTVVEIKGLKLVVNTKEANHARPHCHAKKAGAEASFALDTFECLESTGFSEVALNEIQRLVKIHAEQLMEAWNEYHGE